MQKLFKTKLKIHRDGLIHFLNNFSLNHKRISHVSNRLYNALKKQIRQQFYFYEFLFKKIKFGF